MCFFPTAHSDFLISFFSASNNLKPHPLQFTRTQEHAHDEAETTKQPILLHKTITKYSTNIHLQIKQTRGAELLSWICHLKTQE